MTCSLMYGLVTPGIGGNDTTSPNFFRLAVKNRSHSFAILLARIFNLSIPPYLIVLLLVFVNNQEQPSSALRRFLGDPALIEMWIFSLLLLSTICIVLFQQLLALSELNIRAGQLSSKNRSDFKDYFVVIGLITIGFFVGLMPALLSLKLTILFLSVVLVCATICAFNKWCLKKSLFNKAIRGGNIAIGILSSTSIIVLFSFSSNTAVRNTILKLTQSNRFVLESSTNYGLVTARPGDEILQSYGKATAVRFMAPYEFSGLTLPKESEYQIDTNPPQVIINSDFSTLDTYIPPGSTLIFERGGLTKIAIPGFIPGSFKLRGLTTLRFSDQQLIDAVNPKDQTIAGQRYENGLTIKFDENRRITEILPRNRPRKN
ncbi:MAG: hypothetical protein AAF202_05100 [Pseudomonadota bacterium]